MNDKYQNKYRIASTRLKNWDYGWKGAYFVTICTKDRVHYFGEITNGGMALSQVGILADLLWHEIPNHGKNVTLNAFVVMPNHIHGILILGDDNHDGNDNDNGMVETRHALSLRHHQNGQHDKHNHRSMAQKRFRNPGKNTISSIIGSYKSAVTKHVHRLGFNFAWQSRFYDHIIRNEKSFNRIASYIRNNPLKWQDDTFYT